MTPRRRVGALEAQVLDALWTRGKPATPGEVLEMLDGSVAYTTVMTVLTRLWRKGDVTRSKVGRAFAYAPCHSRDEHFAAKMRHTLASSADHRAVLSRFVDGLSPKDAAALRARLSKTKR